MCHEGGCTRWWCCFRCSRELGRRRRGDGDDGRRRRREVSVPGAGQLPGVRPRVLQQVHPEDPHGGPALGAAASHVSALRQGVLFTQLPPVAHLPVSPRAGEWPRAPAHRRAAGTQGAPSATPAAPPAAPGVAPARAPTAAAATPAASASLFRFGSPGGQAAGGSPARVPSVRGLGLRCAPVRTHGSRRRQLDRPITPWPSTATVLSRHPDTPPSCHCQHLETTGSPVTPFLPAIDHGSTPGISTSTNSHEISRRFHSLPQPAVHGVASLADHLAPNRRAGAAGSRRSAGSAVLQAGLRRRRGALALDLHPWKARTPGRSGSRGPGSRGLALPADSPLRRRRRRPTAMATHG